MPAARSARPRPTRTAFVAALLTLLVVAGLAPLAVSASAATPVLSNLRVTAVTTTSATIAWDTDVASDTQVVYGTTTGYGTSSTLNTTKVTAHVQTLTGLAANQLYHFQARSRDAVGDLATSPDRTFGTPLGTTTVGTSTDTNNSNSINVTRFTTGVGGKVVSMSVYVGAVDASVARRSFQVGIYTVSGSAPGALVASSPTGTLVGNAWNTVPITATLAANTSYFFGYNTNGSSGAVNNLRYVSGGTSGWRSAGQVFGTWPASFGTFSAQSATFTMYATFASDVTPPTVSLTGPAQGATVNGVVTVSANASDDAAVSSVQFRLGAANLGAPDTSAPYAVDWDTRSLAGGPQTLTAVATDTAGLTTTSSAVTVQVSNPARVSITQPTAGSTVNGTTVTVRYTRAGDWVAGDGQHVHLRLDGGGTKMDFDTDGDQSYSFLDVPAGAHTVEAVVADSSHVEQPGSGGTVSFSSTAPDVVPPTVAIGAPSSGATVQNIVTVTAAATDDVAVVGVQFLLDGALLGPEDTTAPYSTDWDTTTATNGPHALTARARDIVNSTTSAAVPVTVGNTDPRSSVGEWGPVVSWPIVAVHATLMRTGQILMWDAWELPNAAAKVWDPTTNVFTDVTVGAGLFCAGQATDANGNVIVVGGHDGGETGIKDVYSFNPDTGAWTRKPDMRYARWYPSLTQLPDGRMITLSGQIAPGNFANVPEIYNPVTSQLSTVPISTPQLHEGQYPQTAVLPNGKLLAISSEQGGLMTFDPATSAWTQLGTTQRPFGVWTSFAPGKFLITGGSATFNSYDPSNPVPSVNGARVLDMTSGAPVWSDATSMANARSFHNVTMLPTGEAMVIGGSTELDDHSTLGTLTAEAWNPATSTWRQLASPARPRMYHSVSMLMPDGRVLSAGGGRLAPAPDQLNMQMYSPGYLFKGPRPTITSLPSTVGYSGTMDLVTPQAADIAKVTLVDLASVTHSADWNQRFVDLPFARNGDTLSVTTPANANVAPPNSYMVFAVDRNGVPSMAKIVKLGTPDTTPPALSGMQTTGIGANAATVSWTSDEPADSQVEYGPTLAYGSTTTRDPALSTSHLQTLTGLTAGTTYHVRVKSSDAAGNPATSGDFTFTTVAPDSVAPTVAVTAPAPGATVSGTVQLSATASDNVAVAGVQFRVDGATVGAEDTSSPYAASWSSLPVPNGTHTVTAVARDTAGNTTTSSAVTVTVANAATTGLVASYGFNEGAGTTVGDGSGMGNAGTVEGPVWTAAGKFGKALTFDGSNDYVTVPDSSTLDPGSAMTLEAWVRPTASSGWRTVLLKENGTGELAYSLYSASGTNRPSAWAYVGGGSGSAIGTAAVPLTAWTHLAATYDGSNLRLYVGGVLKVTKAYSGSVASTAEPLRIGGNAVWGEWFAGQIDEVRVYNKALSVAQIQADMAAAL
jgi:hypothetical protein